MATSTATGRRTGTRASRRAGARVPELDAARGLLLLVVGVVLLRPEAVTAPGWLGPSAWQGLRLADLLPASLTLVAGVALGLQQADRSGRGTPRWLGRHVRRIAVLLVVGTALAWATAGAAVPPDLDALRWTGHLPRLALAGGVAAAVLLLPRWAEATVAATLLLGHGAWLVVAGGRAPAPADAAPAGVDVGLLGVGHALAPVDPTGLVAVVPSVGLLLVGAWVARWLRSRTRGSATAGILGLATGWTALAGVVVGQAVPVNASLWTTPTLLLAAAAVLGLLAGGHLLTRSVATDRLVAWAAVPGTSGLVTWAALVLLGHVLSGARWWASTVGWLAGLVGPATAVLVATGVVLALLVRAEALLVDRDVRLRA